jgi:putative cell wall-binding protein
LHRRSPFRLGVALALTLTIVVVPASSAFAAMSRSLVMDRATRWADAVIPYSQSGWADLDGTIVSSPSLGWRRDCSGFASMSWNLPKPGASTRSLASYADPIQKEALQPGDLILKSGEHAVIFGGWTDTTRTKYWAFEMSSTQSKNTTPPDGSRRRETPYPYWGEDYGYLPYRLRGITESIDYSAYVSPIAGADRYATAAAASRAAWADGSAATVMIASGENWPDALGASALAGAVEGPVLLTRPGSLPAAVAEEIRRLGASEAIVVGGEAAVSPAVLQALDALEGVETTRVGGTDRYATSAALARETQVRAVAAGKSVDTEVFVATGADFPDALAAAPVAYRHLRPILLTTPGELATDTRQAIESLGASGAIVLGGAGAVSEQVRSDLSTLLDGAHVPRLSGDDRYETAMALSAHADESCCMTYRGAALANGAGFADALAGGVMAGRLGVPLLLTPAGRLHSGVADLLSGKAAAFGYVRCLGGDSAVYPIVRETIALMLQSG